MTTTRCTGRSASSPRSPRRTPRCATVPSSTATPADGPGVYAFSRIDRNEQREYVVALNNSEQPATAAIPTYAAKRDYSAVYGDGPARAALRSGRLTDAHGSRRCPPSSTRSTAGSRGRRRRPRITLGTPAPAPSRARRIHVAADVAGSSFYEVTFQAPRRRRAVALDRHRRLRALPGVPRRVRARARARPCATGRSCSTTPGTPRRARCRSATVPAPTLTIEAPAAGCGVRGTVEVRAVADPERASHVVRIERTRRRRRLDRRRHRRLVPGVHGLRQPDPAQPGRRHGHRIPSDARQRPGRRHDQRDPGRALRGPAADRRAAALLPTGRRLHRPGACTCGATRSTRPCSRRSRGTSRGRRPGSPTAGPTTTSPLVDDTKPVNFIMHLPSGDTVPTTREPGGDRSFLPIDHPEVWIVQGDPTVYTTQPPTG